MRPDATTWDDLDAEEVYSGIVRQTFHGERQTMVRYVYSPGSVFPVHHHPEEQITVVVSGVIHFTIDGEDHVLGPGSVAVIPSNVSHGARVTGSEIVETFNAMTPRRERAPGAAAASPDR